MDIDSGGNDERKPTHADILVFCNTDDVATSFAEQPLSASIKGKRIPSNKSTVTRSSLVAAAIWVLL